MPKRGERLRWPPRPRSRSSATHAAPDAQTALAQPNETDTSPDSQRVESDAARDVMQQAHADVESGQEDTDCRNRAAELVAAKAAPTGAKR